MLDQEYDRETKAKALKEVDRLNVNNQNLAKEKTSNLEKDEQNMTKIKHLEAKVLQHAESNILLER